MDAYDHGQSPQRWNCRLPGRIGRLERGLSSRARCFRDEAAKAAALARAKQSEADCEIVDPYAIEIENRNGHYVPKALREVIRASGPTMRRDLGKQAPRRGALDRTARLRGRSPMYRYDEFDAAFVPRASISSAARSRAASRGTDRGTIPPASADERALSAVARLYAARRRSLWHAEFAQLRKLAEIARKYDRGYGHFTTRQNLQYNWPA